MDTQNNKQIYANEVTVSVPKDGKDVVVYFKWATPVFDDNNKPIDKQYVDKIAVTCPRQLLYDLSAIGIELLKDAVDINKERIKEILAASKINAKTENMTKD